MNSRQKEIQQLFLDNEKAVLKKIEENYQDALFEIEDRLAVLLGRDDSDMQHVIYQVEYQKALEKQVEAILETLHSNEFETVSEYLAKSYEDGFMGTMYDMQGQGIPLVIPIDQAQVVAAIQHETKLSEGLYAALGKDTKRLSKQIAGEISRGISNNATYNEMARNIASFSNIPKNNAARIARTEAHRIQCKATADAQWKAKEKGADVVKQWDSTLDGKTRDSHRELDGQIKELDEPFEVSGKKAMQPGDFGDPSEDCNCRCALLQRARWLLDAESSKHIGNTDKMTDKQLQPIADKLGIDVDELRKYSDQIIPVKAKNYDDFRRQYEKLVNHDQVDRVRSSVQKMNRDFVPARTNEEIAEASKRTLGEAYETHRIRNNLNATPYDESSNFISVKYGKIDTRCAESFDSTLSNLTEKYDTPLQTIRIMTKNEFAAMQGKGVYAFTYHDYDIDKATIVINPAKFRDFDAHIDKMKNLMLNGYAVNIGEQNAERYIMTHEFAHSLINTGEVLDPKRNWLNADYGKIKKARKEIESVFSEYADAIGKLEKAQKDAELLAITSFDDDAWKKAQELSEMLSKERLSRYSMESSDEFMAEAFTAEQFGVGNGWSRRITDIVDSYFKK